jgi:hypothetical protein
VRGRGGGWRQGDGQTWTRRRAAAAGYLTPLFASLLMLLSSTAVLLNSLRLSRRQAGGS